MERPTDSYKEIHNITLSLEDTLFGGQVSNLQVAELIAFMAKNRSLSYCKVVEVIAETTVPLTPLGELLEKIPSQCVEVYPPKEPAAADGPVPSASTEIESTQAKETTTRPLSPYTAYADLKPPTSPSPKAPGDVKDVNIVEAASTPSDTDSDAEPKSPAEEMLITRPLSPYAAYEDLKPPCSPCPTPSGPKEMPAIASTLRVEAASVVEKDPSQAINSCQSPYPVYEGLKPPTSPSPSPKKL